ncbi:MAG: recombination regulator RecX [Oscillospiraceae bacterium]|nr:recombination regulator RecX [Oscillospiraceae bacterium]
MTVTAIRQESPERLRVTLDSGEEIESTLGAVTALRLFVGRTLDEEALAELRTESVRALAREKALTIVARRQMSARELKDKLRQKGVDPETAAWCADWLTERGFIDEQAYAAAVVRHYAAKGCGAGRVRAELARRGIPRELADEALEAMPEADGKLDRLIAAKLRDPNDRDEVRKLSASLYRRGFSAEEIRSALRRYEADFED